MIFIALGANLPWYDYRADVTLKAAARILQDAGVEISGSSYLYATAPVPVSDQPWFYNAVLSVETTMKPESFLTLLNEIEAGFGRVRTVQNAPRILDLDIIDWKGQIRTEDEHLILPHPRMHERAFVLYPLRDIAPEWKHPASGRALSELIAAIPGDQKIEKCAQKIDESDEQEKGAVAHYNEKNNHMPFVHGTLS